MVAIIIPAYNEETVIGRTLRGLLEGPAIPNLEIIVCCNGCTDRTAEIAREFGHPVRVLETPRGSKTGALNMGDAAASTFPRIYLDADIQLDRRGVARIVEALQSEAALAVAPRMRVDLTDRQWSIKAFYHIWLKTPYHTQGMIGSGLYALSEKGRARFAEFPDIIADDAFARAHFAPQERRILEDCTFTVVPPATFGALLKIKTRSLLGDRELRHKYPRLIQNLRQSEAMSRRRTDYWQAVRRPAQWPKLAVYAAVKLISAVRARSQLKHLQTYRWERDDTSRKATDPAVPNRST